MISWFIQQGSSYAADVDYLIALIGVIVGVWFIVAEILVFALIFKFRAKAGIRTQYVAGEDKSEKRWVSYPHYAVLVFDVVIVVAALRVWNDVKVAEPAAEETVRIVSQQWAWTFVHAGPDGKLDTADDIRTVDDLHVQQNRVYRFELHSKDVLHSFSVPVFRLKQDAVPGRMIAGWFRPTVAGTFDIQCAEICGIGHAFMPGRIHVEPQAQHQAWVTEHAGEMPVVAMAAATGAPGAAVPVSPAPEAEHAGPAAAGEQR